jgi:N-methylhydantoinase B
MYGIEALLDYGEEMTRKGLARIPRGTYEAVDYIDDDGVGNGPFEMRVRVTVTDEKFICDFTGSHPQVPGPINAGRTGLESAVRVVFKALTDPAIPANEGCFRPLEIICPDGTVTTAIRPAPVSTYWETMDFCADLVWKALASALPDRLPMGHFLSVCGTVVSGIHPDTGELFILVEPQAGGWGAGADRDGENALVCIGDGETYIIPVEVCETRYGVLVDQFALSVADGGAGRYRGGRGLIRDYRITADEALVTGTFGRFKFFPWGTKGGQDGSPNYMQMLHEDGSSKVFGKTARYKLRRGEVARLITGTGGGYGDPYARSEEEIAQDVRDGYITPTMAERDYGVVVDPYVGVKRTARPPSRSGPAVRTATRGDRTRNGEKSEAVLGILRGETSVSAVALRLGVDRAEVEHWVDEFLKAGEGALRGGAPTDDSENEIGELRSVVRELANQLSELRRSMGR